MTDTKPRDLIKLLIDALKKECNWIDNPKYDELIAKANIYLAQYELEEPASTMSPSERWAVLGWVEDRIDTNKALRSWRDSTRGGLLMAEVHTVQPGVRARLAQAEPEVPTDEELNSKSSPNNLQIRSSDITPPSELVQQWRSEWIYNAPGDLDELGFLTERGAQWGADQELEACVDWISKQDWTWTSAQLRTARRPKLPSLKELALQALNDAVKMADDAPPEGICSDQADIIRRALEQLDD
jgi:hypothetical protein